MTVNTTDRTEPREPSPERRPPASGDATVQHRTVHHEGVALAVSRGGRGRPLLLCPGLLSTRSDLRELTGLLRRDFDVTTFDLRGHGRSTAADQYRFDSFLGDLAAVAAAPDLPSPPVLVGHSLGADLAVHYAAEHPGAVAGLVLVDGANPLPEPFLTETDLAAFRAMAEDMERAFASAGGTDRRILLGAADVVDLNIEIDAVRSDLLDRYRKIDLPISVIASTAMAGSDTEAHARRRNRNWRAGFERLVRERPQTAATWLDAGHDLVATRAPEIARIIRDAWGPAARTAS